jgi:5-methylcytosine-specific restriction endonuclease McrA
MSEDACRHPRTQLWRLTLSTGIEHCRPVCEACGAILNAVAKSTLGEAYASLPRGCFAEFRERYNERWRHAWEQRWEAQRQQREAERREERAAWFAKYDQYLRTPAWRSLRAKVLRRANGTCEACLECRATQVHHKTYERVFSEAAFDLVAICDQCHGRLHPRDEETAA